MPCRSFWFDCFWGMPIGSGRRFAWNLPPKSELFGADSPTWSGLVPSGAILNYLAGCSRDHRSRGQLRSEAHGEPHSGEEVVGTAAQAEAARRSICVFGVGWYSRPPSMKFVGRLSAALVNVKMYHS